jgi:hypothetical protein
LCKTKNPKVAGHGQNRSKMTILKGDVDGFSYFSLISIMKTRRAITPSKRAR